MESKKLYKRVFAVALAASFALGNPVGMPGSTPLIPEVFAEEETTELQSPRVAFNTRDTISFGEYWQYDTNGDQIANEDDAKQSITWQVLGQDGDDLILISDKILDYQPYHKVVEEYVEGQNGQPGYTKYEKCTWETSNYRKWLNDDFKNNAFTEEQQADLQEDVNGDKVFLLSVEEMENLGLNSDAGSYDRKWLAGITDYVSTKGVNTNPDQFTEWFMVSPDNCYHYWAGYYGTNAESMAYCILATGMWYYNNITDPLGVRPAIRLKASDYASYVSEKAVNVSIAGTEWDIVNMGTYEGAPITWRVLNVNGNDAFLLADTSLVKKAFSAGDDDLDWKDSQIRKWLNEDFYNDCFSDEEKAAIKTSVLKNSGNETFRIAAEDDTEDKVFLLSLKDSVNSSYGFEDHYYCDSETRTDNSFNSEDDYWILRNPYDYDWSVATVNSYGFCQSGDRKKKSDEGGIRPALHVDLSKLTLTKAGTVTAGDPAGGETIPNTSADDTPIEIAEPQPTEKSDPTPEATPTPDAESTPKPAAPTKAPEATPTKAPEVDSTASPEATPTIKPAPAKDNKTTFSIKNKAKVKKSAKIKVKDKDKIQKITLNGKTIKIKKNKTSITIKLKSYKKALKKSGKWNKLVVIDANGNKKSIKFKTK